MGLSHCLWVPVCVRKCVSSIERFHCMYVHTEVAMHDQLLPPLLQGRYEGIPSPSNYRSPTTLRDTQAEKMKTRMQWPGISSHHMPFSSSSHTWLWLWITLLIFISSYIITHHKWTHLVHNSMHSIHTYLHIYSIKVYTSTNWGYCV